MSIEVCVPDPDAMHALGVRLGRALGAGDLVVLTGPLGAGKTTLTRGIGEGLGVRTPITSPTFVLARTHPSLVGGPPLVHVDAYRLGSAAELDDLDLDYDRAVVVVEWGRGLLDGVSDSWLDVEISREATASAGAGSDRRIDDGVGLGEERESRRVVLAGHGSRWPERTLADLAG